MVTIKKTEQSSRAYLVSILILAAILRLVNLGHQSLWIDEINAVLLADKSILKILLYGDTASPFIYLVNHFWQKLGTGDFMVRLPSVAFGIASIYAAYKLAKALFGVSEALFSSFLMAVSLYHVMYSQDAARPYSAYIFFSLLSLYCFYQILNSDSKKYRIGFIVFNICNLYTHYFSIFVLLAEIITLLIFIVRDFFKGRTYFTSNRNKIINFFNSLKWILVMSLPIAVGLFFASQSELAGGKVIFNVIYYKNLLCRYGAGNGLAFFIYNLFFLAGIFSLFRKDERREIFFLIFLMIFPFIILSFLQLKHFFHIRYVIFTYPVYIIIVSKGITNIIQISKKHSNIITAFLIVVFLTLSLAPLTLYYQMPARLSDWRGAADYVYANANANANANEGDRVITNGVHDTLIKYYLERKSPHKEISVITHNNSLSVFEDLLLTKSGPGWLYYVGYGEDVGYGTDEFSLLAEDHFNYKEVFFSEVYDKLGKRELIDWDGNSWVDVGVRGYRLVVYSNKK